MVNKLRATLAFLAVAISAWISIGGFPSSGIYRSSYTGPCDIVTCAEAYSMTRAMKANYTGPLFQLYNGTTTKDIGQIASTHLVDMSTWSAFCSGVASNCVISTVYAQINSANNLVPSSRAPFVVNPNCSTSTYVCASPFMIEVASGLPALRNSLGGPGGNPVAPEYYVGTVGGDDTAMTGVTAGNNPITILYAGRAVGTQSCCGAFGIGHKYNGADTIGTTFFNKQTFGQYPSSNPSNCSTTTTFCFGADQESDNQLVFGDDLADYSSGPDFVAAISFDGTANTNTTSAYMNGTLLFAHSPPNVNYPTHTVNPGQFLHFGGGGDLSQPAPGYMREALITNSVLTGTQETNLYNNIHGFYASAATNTQYVGLGDAQSGAVAYLGLRAYSRATIGNKAINIRRSSDNHTCDINTTTGGGLGNTAGCSTGGDNGQSVSSFCNATSCFVTEVYDQTGNGNNVLQATSAAQPQLNLTCVSGVLPCMVFNGSTQWLLGTTCAVASFPLNDGAMVERTGNTAAFTGFIAPCANAGVGNGVFFNNSANTFACNNTTAAPVTQGGLDNYWHVATCSQISGTNIRIDVDSLSNITGGGTTFNSGDKMSLGATSNAGSISGPFTGNLTEAWVYSTALSLTQTRAMCQSQYYYWGVPLC